MSEISDYNDDRETGLGLQPGISDRLDEMSTARDKVSKAIVNDRMSSCEAGFPGPHETVHGDRKRKPIARSVAMRQPCQPNSFDTSLFGNHEAAMAPERFRFRPLQSS
ncbi:hypothetical protein HUG20_16870 [Salicibibacter cibi]|uniref:Uncharacterized protein n=1 Tax=Salicibibacter cibi TaxID=2743001 RepID=A0A7T6ZDS5_9BACI|nr:hypothetical protein [Salicibibacter cibi]QQK81417.1 hypothetical protein HUG20_16870 [Salicibibacter cibi]